MADRVVQLKDKDNNNIFPVASVANAANIRMTDTDPGEGSALEAGNYVAVYGQNGFIETADIADEAVTADKIDFTTLYDVLYTGSSNGSITLSSSAANYDRLKIFYSYGSSGRYSSIEVINPNGQSVILDVAVSGGSSSIREMYTAASVYSISGSTITIASNESGESVIRSNNTQDVTTSKAIYITRVEGWNF